MNLQKATLEQLKAAAYDELIKLEQARVNLRACNAELTRREELEKQKEVKEKAG